MLTLFRSKVLRHKAEYNDPLVLHIQMHKRVVFFDALSSWSLQTVTGKDHVRSVDLHRCRKCHGTPVGFQSQCLISNTHCVFRTSGYTGCELKLLKVGIIVSGWKQSQSFKMQSHIIRRQQFAFCSGQSPAQLWSTQIFHVSHSIGRSKIAPSGRCLSHHRRLRTVRFRNFSGRVFQSQLLQSPGVAPLGKEDLRLIIGGTIRGPGQMFAIRTENWQTVETWRMSHSDRLMLASRIDQIQFEICEPMTIRREDQILSTRMKIRSPRHCSQMSQLLLITPVQIHRHDFGRRPVFGESSPADLLSIRTEERTTVIAGRCCQTLHVRTVRLHHINLIGPGWIQFKGCSFFRVQFTFVSRTI